MTFLSSLLARRTVAFSILCLIGVACSQVKRDYGDTSGSVADSAGEAGESPSGGKGGAGGVGNGGHGGAKSGAAGAAEAGAAGSSSGSALTVTLAGTGAGQVTSDVPGIACGATCTADFDAGTKVVLTAVATTGSTFSGWSGAGCSGTDTCQTTISGATEVTATFDLAQVAIAVTLAGAGTGTVTSTPTGINCGTACSLAVDSGTSVQLTAMPAVGSLFTGWSGGGCTGTDPCSVVVTAATNVTATFAVATPLLTVIKAGSGLGSVTSSPAGINCGTDCSEPYPNGTMVTLSAATTGTGSVFTGWSGGGCTGTSTCLVPLTAAATVTANFTCSASPINGVVYGYVGSKTTFTVPTCVTSLTIDAYGAQGGNALPAATYPGGKGARMKATVPVTGGSTLIVLVGGHGIDAFDNYQEAGGTGGGGTFVVSLTNSPLVIAGGGGGGTNLAGLMGPGSGGSIGTAGLADNSGNDPGGVNGGGGATCSNSNFHAGTGGGGLLGNGPDTPTNATYGGPNTGGVAFVNGGYGGTGGSCLGATTCSAAGRSGGFGGGGAAGYTGGGGGGYSGGGSSCPGGTLGTPTGGGGGSFVVAGATTLIATAGYEAGFGAVIFTY